MIPPDHDWLDVIAGISAFLLGLGGISGLVGALIYVYQSRANKRAIEAKSESDEAEADKTKAETVQLYQSIADNAAQKALRLEERIATLEGTLQTKDKRIDELEHANAEKDRKIAALQCEVDELRQKVAMLEAEKKAKE